MNGNAVADEALPALPEAAPPQPDAATLIDNQIGPMIGMVVRGILSGAPSIPAGLVLNSIARQTGKMLALSVVGNPVETVVKARREFSDSFSTGMAKVSILQVNPQQPRPNGNRG